MAHSTIKGATVPDAGDDLLAAWDAYDRTVGTIMPANSPAAARTILASAEAAGVGPTAAHPWYFDMAGIIYRATGAKTATGAFTLAPVNEVERYIVEAGNFENTGNSIHLDKGQWAIANANAPTKPYDRIAFAWGMADGYFTAGSGSGINLEILIQNKDGQIARFPNTGTEQSTSVMSMGYVPAGVDPEVILAAKGDGTFTITNNSAANRLLVLFFPVSMA